MKTGGLERPDLMTRVTRSMKKQVGHHDSSGKKSARENFTGKKLAGKKLPGKKSEAHNAAGPSNMTGDVKKGEPSKKKPFGKDSTGKKSTDGAESPIMMTSIAQNLGKKTSGKTPTGKKREEVIGPSGKKSLENCSTGKNSIIRRAGILTKMSRDKPSEKEPSGKKQSQKKFAGKKVSGKEMKEEEGKVQNETGNKWRKEESLERKMVVNHLKETGKTSAKKNPLLGSSKDEEKGKGLGIQSKTVRKRKIQVQENDGINRLRKFSKLGQGCLEKTEGAFKSGAKREGGSLGISRN